MGMAITRNHIDGVVHHMKFLLTVAHHTQVILTGITFQKQSTSMELPRHRQSQVDGVAPSLVVHIDGVAHHIQPILMGLNHNT